MKINELKSNLLSGQLDEKLAFLYGQEQLESQRKRYEDLLSEADSRFGDHEAVIVSAPGRTEIGGNHTDHQLGRVMAGAINLDAVAIVVKTDNYVIDYQSKAFKVNAVSLDDLSIHPEEINTTESLIRGICARYTQLGYKIGGFSCYAESDVLPGSGMSSSAAFEVLIAEILNVLYNEETVNPVIQAMVGQYAENVYFGKASGLMDQMACSVGSFISIDFKEKLNPIVNKIPFDFANSGYCLILTDCKQSHADLSDEYSLIPSEMRSAARIMGHEVLSECTIDELMKNADVIRETCGDRAFLRSYHFLTETDRVIDEREALERNDFDAFLKLVVESGHSSYMYLQNVYPPNDSKHQSLAVGLAISEMLLKNNGGYRVHGGGFAGTIQAFVPAESSELYIRTMESVFGKGACYKLSIRSVGGYKVI